MKLTKNRIDKLAKSEKDTFHWDDELKGFGLRVNAAGKNFVVQGRIGSGRTARAVRLSIGPYGVFTPDQARDRARKHLATMRDGLDPRAANQRAGALRKTVSEVVEDYKRDRPLKERSLHELGKTLAGPFTKFGWNDKPLASITRAEVLSKYLDMKERAPFYANRTFGTLRTLFNYASHEYVETDGSPIFKDNPVNALYRKWSQPRARTDRIPDDKLQAVWSYLSKARAEAHQRDTLAAVDVVSFLLLTGARFSEASELTWDRVNLDEGWWHLPDPKNRNPVWLPLSRQAVELLTTRPTRQGYIFPTARGHIKDPRGTMRNISKVAGCELSPHDLRRTFTNTGVRICNIELWKIELLTNHVPKSVTTRHYMETQRLQYLLPEVQAIADKICESM